MSAASFFLLEASDMNLRLLTLRRLFLKLFCIIWRLIEWIFDYEMINSTITSTSTSISSLLNKCCCSWLCPLCGIGCSCLFLLLTLKLCIIFLMTWELWFQLGSVSECYERYSQAEIITNTQQRKDISKVKSNMEKQGLVEKQDRLLCMLIILTYLYILVIFIFCVYYWF